MSERLRRAVDRAEADARRRDVEAVADALRAGVEHLVPIGTPVSLLFSGGVDSSLLAHLLRTRPVQLVTIGVAGSRDLEAAAASASALGLSWRPTLLDRDEIATAGASVPPLPAPSSTPRSVGVALALAIAAATPGLVVCGQGADELAFGYAHFRGLGPDAAEARAEVDLAELRDRAWPAAVQGAADVGRQLVAPFLEPEMVRIVRAVRRAWVPGEGEAKPLLRAVARRWDLPESIAARRKVALQYGTGVDRALRRGPAPG